MEVTLLTQENCTFCEQAKDILDRLSGEYALSVSTLDLGTPEGQALAERGGVERLVADQLDRAAAGEQLGHRAAVGLGASAGAPVAVVDGRSHAPGG